MLVLHLSTLRYENHITGTKTSLLQFNSFAAKLFQNYYVRLCIYLKLTLLLPDPS